jgi:hypothetical protein
VIECVPTLRPDVVNVAEPPLRVAEPIVVAPSKKVIAPVAFAGSDAVKVTESPYFDGFSEEETDKVGAPLFTT